MYVCYDKFSWQNGEISDMHAPIPDFFNLYLRGQWGYFPIKHAIESGLKDKHRKPDKQQ